MPYLTLFARVDCSDVLSTAGHRIGTAEIESALVGHGHVVEAAVVGFPHRIKGEGIFCYVTLVKAAMPPGEDAKLDLILHVRERIGAFAAPDVIVFATGLPKVR